MKTTAEVALAQCGYHPQISVTEVKHRPRRIVIGWGTKIVD